MGLTLEGPSFF